jgi:uncharacterized protein (TIGR02421 family)
LIDPEFLAAVAARLERGHRVRRRIPGGGIVHVDRSWPFVVLHRSRESDHPLARLVSSHSAHVRAEERSASDPGLSDLVATIARSLAGTERPFLLIELWERPRDEAGDSALPFHAPGFRLVRSSADEGYLRETIDVLLAGLPQIRLRDRTAIVETILDDRPSAPGFPRLEPNGEGGPLVVPLGLVVEPCFRDPEDGALYPAILLELEYQLFPVLEQAVLAFLHGHAREAPTSWHALGRRTLGGASWTIDRRLDEVVRSFDFLPCVTPVNSEDAREEFESSGREKAPRLRYRPLRVDPELAKRRLFAIPLERVEDPVLSRLFREQQEELDRKITMLVDRGTERFLCGSIALYGAVEDDLLAIARDVLDRVSPLSRADSVEGSVDAEGFAREARRELERFRRRLPSIETEVEVREDFPPGLLVTGNRLVIGAASRFPRNRVEALVQHEVGTHLLTYCNGRSQRILQFAHGLAGYEALQEGLAVFAEYLVGGLSPGRMRTLAARVVACHALVEGADFVETFRLLHGRHDMPSRSAFSVTLRVYRGGGLTKDAIYLRGLLQLLRHLEEGGEIEPLYVGKIATRHIPLIDFLRHRNFFRSPPLRPAYLSGEGRERLARAREGIGLPDLVRRAA